MGRQRNVRFADTPPKAVMLLPTQLSRLGRFLNFPEADNYATFGPSKPACRQEIRSRTST